MEFSGGATEATSPAGKNPSHAPVPQQIPPTTGIANTSEAIHGTSLRRRAR
jgi:hypothetical protein